MDLYQHAINKTILPFLVYALVFSLFLGTAVFSIFIVLTIVLWSISGEFKVKLSSVRANPVVLSSLLLFLIITIGLLWAHVPWSEKLPMYMKYHKLLYIPIIVSILKTDQQRSYAMNAFLVVSLMILFISYGKFLGLLPFHDEGMGYIVTRNRIAHGIFMAFAAFLMLHRMARHHGVYRYVWAILAVLAVANVLFLVNGRTGQVILLALVGLFIWQLMGLKSIKYFLVAGLLGLVAFKSLPIFEQSRLGGLGQEMKDPNSSAGLRMGFYQNTFEMIKKHPLIGVGTGAFKSEYHQQVGEVDALHATTNPHNQYLLIAVEVGTLGLLVFLCFLLSVWQSSAYMAAQNLYAAQGLLLLFALGSLFNSLLLDAGEGRFYCTLLGVLVGGLRLKKI